MEVCSVTCKRIGGGYWLAIASEDGRKVAGMADSETEARRRCSYLSHRLAWTMRRELREDPGLGTYVTFRVSRDSVPTRTYLFAPSAIDVFETVGELVLEL